MKQQLQVFCDFDGTITTRDTTDFLLAKLADPKWKEVEARWERGEIGSRQCMAEQVPLIQGGWEAVKVALNEIVFDPTFRAFARWCHDQDIPIQIISDGIDKVIKHLLLREKITGIDGVVANHLVEGENGQLALTFPWSSPVTGCASGVCKCRLLDKAGPVAQTIVIGDGRSDMCWGPTANHLFAKSKLLLHCRANDIPCFAFSNFEEVKCVIEEQILQTPKPHFEPVYQPMPVFEANFAGASRTAKQAMA